jgi:hypothetical protein
MIRYQRSMQLKRGKHGTRWARELTDYINTVHAKPSFQLLRSRFGNVSTVYWIADFKDLASLEAWQHKVGADPGYRELVKKSIDIVIDGSIDDVILEFV